MNLRETTDVIASEAKQSTSPHGDRMNCFVASLLAMTEEISTGVIPGRAQARTRNLAQ